MHSLEKLHDCENFIEEVLQSNHFPQIHFQQKDSQRFPELKVLQSQVSTSSKIMNQIQAQKIQRQGSPKTKSQTSVNEQLIRRGHWGQDENLKYHWFLELHYKHFIGKEKRRFDKIFKTMSTFLSSRQAEQCRSHHQKMQKKYHSFCNILLFLRRMHYEEESTSKLEQDLRQNHIDIQQELISQIQLHELCSKKHKINNTLNSKLNQKQKMFDREKQRQANGQNPRKQGNKKYHNASPQSTANSNANFQGNKNENKITEEKQQTIEKKQNMLVMEMQMCIESYREKEKNREEFYQYKFQDFLAEDYQHRFVFDHFII